MLEFSSSEIMELKIKVSDKAFDFPELKNGAQSFRWLSVEKIQEKDLNFPIDRKVIGLLKKEFLRKT